MITPTYCETDSRYRSPSTFNVRLLHPIERETNGTVMLTAPVYPARPLTPRVQLLSADPTAVSSITLIYNGMQLVL